MKIYFTDDADYDLLLEKMEEMEQEEELTGRLVVKESCADGDEMEQDTIEVPVAELRKLEEVRVKMYEYLGTKLCSSDLAMLTGCTQQIWKVANTKKWS